MAWAPYTTVHTTTSGGYMTSSNPAPRTVPANPRSWKPALPTARTAPFAASLTTEIALRGDQRSPAQIDLVGGIWSHLFGNPNAASVGSSMNYPAGVRAGRHRAAPNGGPAGGPYRYPAARFSPHTHQAGPGSAPFVSFTRDIHVAKGFATTHGYVYLVRVNVGVDYNHFAGGNAAQAEVMALQGVALRDILAVRSLSDNRISINTSFQAASMSQQAFNAGLALLSS